MLNDEVAGFINYFSSHQGHGPWSMRWRAADVIANDLRARCKEKGVPQDLIYLAQAESGFHPLALSRAEPAACGSSWPAVRRGTACSATGGSMSARTRRNRPARQPGTLKTSITSLATGIWPWQPTTPGREPCSIAVERTGYADYWELYRRGVLPQETRNYVPIILAVTIMAKNPSQYGLDDIVAGAADSL